MSFSKIPDILHDWKDTYRTLPRWQQVTIGLGGIACVGIAWAAYSKFKSSRKEEEEYYPHVPHLTATQVVNCNNHLGECCLWDDRKQLLCWIDNYKKQFWTYDPKTKESNSYDLPEEPGSFALCEDGSLLIAFASGPAFYDLETAKMSKKLYEYEPDILSNMNDGRCDRYGRFVVGGVTAFHKGATNPISKFIQAVRNTYQYLYGKTPAIHRINEDLSHQVLVTGVMCANSICFGLDGSTMYYTDSFTQDIRKLDYYSSRKIPDNDRIFVPKFRSRGFPDGSVVDSNDNVWNATFGIGKVTCRNKEGEVIMVVDVPEPCVTCCTFGGEKLDTLFITTLGGEVFGTFNAGKDHGNLYAVDVPNMSGCIENRFKGSIKQLPA